MNNRIAILFFIGVSVLNGMAKKTEAPAGRAGETVQQRNERMGWWRDARFGMFIHWGVYAVPAGTYNDKQIGGIGEWIMNRGKIPGRVQGICQSV